MAADWADGLSPVRGMEQARCLRWAGGNWVGVRRRERLRRRRWGWEGGDRAKGEAVD